jgi:hypothetical protein
MKRITAQVGRTAHATASLDSLRTLPPAGQSHLFVETPPKGLWQVLGIPVEKRTQHAMARRANVRAHGAQPMGNRTRQPNDARPFSGTRHVRPRSRTVPAVTKSAAPANS